MSTVQRFQDLRAWQLARDLNRLVYSATAHGAFSKDFGLRDQIRRARISVSSNVAEGFARRSPRDFARFLTIAKASAAEVHSQLYLALDLDYIGQSDFADLTAHLDQTSKTIGGLLRYLRSPEGSATREPGTSYYTELGTQNSELPDS